MTTDDSAFRDKGKFKKGHPGYNKPQHSPPTDDADIDFDTAVLAAAADFGTRNKPKVGLAGYVASLRDTRPQDFALMVSRAQSRRTIVQNNAAMSITVEVVPCPSNYFMPSEEARALWAARTGAGPQLIVDNADTSIENADEDEFDADPDDDTAA